MVNTFLKSRFTRKRITNDQLNKVYDVFGLLTNFKKTKVIHSMSTVLIDNDLYSIKIGPKSPKSKDDFWALNFLRAFSDCILTTGKILRSEPDAFHPAILQEVQVTFIV